jgi:hypothetical protein
LCRKLHRYKAYYIACQVLRARTANQEVSGGGEEIEEEEVGRERFASEVADYCSEAPILIQS